MHTLIFKVINICVSTTTAGKGANYINQLFKSGLSTAANRQKFAKAKIHFC